MLELGTHQHLLSKVREATEYEKERCLKIVERQRQKVLNDNSDPSWTEHFADIINAIKSDEYVE